MKVAILGANGKAGSAILAEAKKRGIEVTAIVRAKEKITDGTPVIEKDVYQLTASDIKEFDVLVSALGFWGDVSEFTGSTQHLIDILNGLNTRLLVVGGAGSLYVDQAHTMRLSETPDFPEAFKPLATAMGKGLDLLKEAKNIHWTYISPAAEFDAEGPKTGKYVAAGEELETDAAGKSYISYADYAIAMVDEIQNNAHPEQRFSVHQ
ncbi:MULTISPECIES: NAD(P)-dependent oxidoreductase [unclassified Enterococcus]|uniref:NAD(P)-dependent oxidoreductase n=1 Tax=unclassified Enterococcus TaxID=2608891 RepID=UPI001CE1B08A|nr:MULTISPECIES: NAD(P)-dependent oxidoreductase [unclassified Enterococcus]MCA5014480.1 NAD(P)-dependent oxidoreductase [Enterococcus sp. S23]MCA5017406.1 NAD(P)-dependent oxidoreductase [Enterococcus sp. S22(2020)]